MCDMQKMPRDDCEEEGDMNFAAFSAVGGTGTHFMTSGGAVPVAKIQQGVASNSMTQVVGVVGGVSEGIQYGGIQAAPQFISVPINLPGAKPGEPQPMVQIQVLNPNLLQPQQQKYQMQIPIQGYQGGGAVLTVAYSPETNDAMQLLSQNPMQENIIMTTMPQEMQIVQQQVDDKSQVQANMPQVFITPNQQIIINAPESSKTVNNNNNEHVVIKEECDDTTNDEESLQGTETSDSTSWSMSNSHADLVKYLNSLAPQQTQSLPLSLQQFLRLNPAPLSTSLGCKEVELEVDVDERKDDEAVAEAIIGEDGSVRIQSKKKKKYKKKASKPARPKPGQVVIAMAEDGTPIYCCPECQLAFPDKEQLESHLAVHKIVRRFICGICGAGLKRKEHLERHKLGHNPERPYVCGVCRKGFKRREHLNLHTVIHSGVKTEMCTECGKGFYRKDHLRKHARSHETKRARDEGHSNSTPPLYKPEPAAPGANVLPEITIHVPTSLNTVPVQINIPQHVVSSLEATQTQQQQHDTQAQLEALLAQHS